MAYDQFLTGEERVDVERHNIKIVHGELVDACVEIKFCGAFIDATPARWRGDAGSSTLDGASTAASSPRNAPDALVDFHTGPHLTKGSPLLKCHQNRP